MSGGVAITIQDNGLGQVSAGSGRTIVVIGTSSIGTANQPTATSNPQTLITTYGYGPGVEAAALIANQTGNPVIFIKGGDERGRHELRHQVRGDEHVHRRPDRQRLAERHVRRAHHGHHERHDWHERYPVHRLPRRGPYERPRQPRHRDELRHPEHRPDAEPPERHDERRRHVQLVLTEPHERHVLGERHPSLYGFQTPFLNILLLVGDSAAADVTSFGTQQTALMGRKQFVGMICNARDALWGGASTETEATWMASIEANFVNTFQPYIAVAAGHYNVPSPISQIQYRRPLAWLAAVIDASQNPRKDSGRSPAARTDRADPLRHHAADRAERIHTPQRAHQPRPRPSSLHVGAELPGLPLSRHRQPEHDGGTWLRLQLDAEVESSSSSAR